MTSIVTSSCFGRSSESNKPFGNLVAAAIGGSVSEGRLQSHSDPRVIRGYIDRKGAIEYLRPNTTGQARKRSAAAGPGMRHQPAA
jgi:hypothetical protein